MKHLRSLCLPLLTALVTLLVTASAWPDGNTSAAASPPAAPGVPSRLANRSIVPSADVDLADLQGG